MKPSHPIILSCLLASAATIHAQSQSSNPPATTGSSDTTSKKQQAINSAWRASDIIGTDVHTAGDEKIGEIKDLAVDMKSGRVLAVVISSGGFLGMGDSLSSVPPNALTFTAGSKSFRMNATKEQLLTAPQHKPGDEPDYQESSTMEKMRTFRNSIGGDVAAADNTARNERDADESTLTPVDQGNSEDDIRITREIRSALMNEELSMNAKNIKIITKDKRVTLRGVVDHASEHEMIVRIARTHAGESNVTDSLEVKKN